MPILKKSTKTTPRNQPDLTSQHEIEKPGGNAGLFFLKPVREITCLFAKSPGNQAFF
jgi:hypothetical protein